MNNLYSKLLSTSILNAIAAGLNFLSNFIIVKIFSLEIFGQFAIFSSYLAFGGLFYLIIPPNYSIFKLQDSFNFKPHLIRFFILSTVAFYIFSLISNLFIFRDIYIITILVFGISSNFINFLNITYQASGKILEYFKLLVVISLLKISTIAIFYFSGLLHSLSTLLWTISVAQCVVIIFYLYNKRKILYKIHFSPYSFISTLVFIKNNFTSFTPYYLNTILKRMRENSIILIFSKIVSGETMGIFALFIKIDAFVLGLARNVETFFMNRENIKNHRNEFYKKAISYAFALQILYLGVGVTYMKILANNYFWLAIFIQSLLVYPHIYFLLARSELLSKFNNKELNFSEAIYLFIVLVGFVLGLVFHLNSIYLLLVTYITAKFGLQLFMIIKNQKKYEALNYS